MRTGVAILIRSSLLENGIIIAHSPHADIDGRLMHLKIEWGGHKLRLINAYLPSSDPKGQKDFIISRLTPLIQSLEPSEQPILAGDFNFTDNWLIDRLSSPTNQLTYRDIGPARTMSSLCSTHHLHDTFRKLHPTNTHPQHFTYMPSNIPTSRLDRIYTTTQLLPFIHSSLTSHDTGPSDHRPVHIHLRPCQVHASPLKPPQPRTRVRMTFSSDMGLMKQFLQRVAELTADAPSDDNALVTWWPSFKVQLRATIKQLNQQLREVQTTPTGREKAATTTLQEAMSDMQHSTTPALLLPKVLAAQREKRKAMIAASIGPERSARLAWLRAGEHASPLITKLISPPKSSNDIPCVRCRQGTGLVTDARLIAQEMADFFASVSSAPPRNIPAEDMVIAALKSHARPFSTQQAEAAGRREVTTDEVAAAIASSAPGKAPGPDGLPINCGGNARMSSPPSSRRYTAP